MSGRKPGPEMPVDMAYTEPELDVYVPPGESGQDTAVLLTGTADEYGIPQRQIRSDGRGGFWISEQLADIVYADTEPPDEAPAATGSTTK